MSQQEEKDKKAMEFQKTVETAVLAFITDNGARKAPEVNDYVASVVVIKGILDRLTAKAKAEAEKIHAAHQAKMKELQAQIDKAMAEAATIERAVEYLNKSA